MEHPNAFIGKTSAPTEEELDAALGPSAETWKQLLDELASTHRVNIQEWKSYSVKAGWSMQVKLKKRTIVHLAPCKDCFRVAFILGDRAVEAARQSTL